MWGDGIVFGLITIGLIALSIKLNYWEGISFVAPWLDNFLNSPTTIYITCGIVLASVIGIHFSIRKFMAKGIMKQLSKLTPDSGFKGNLSSAFAKNIRFWRSTFSKSPAGWNRKSRKQVETVLLSTDEYVQTLNNVFTDPSGEKAENAPDAFLAAAEATPNKPTMPTDNEEPVQQSA